MEKEKTGFFSRSDWQLAGILFAAGFLLYAHTLSFDLVWLDDNILILKNRPLLANVANLGKFFTSGVFMTGNTFYYRPLLNVSFMLDTLLNGPLYFIFHFTNVALHAAAGSLFFLLLRELDRDKALAFVLSLAFLCHPALAQAAAWIPGRNDSLVFVLATLASLSFLKFLKRRSAAAFAGYLVFLLAALFTKETAAMLPLLLWFYAALVFTGRLNPRAWGALATGSAAALAVYFLARIAVFPLNPASLHDGLHALLPGLKVFLLSLGQTVFPLDPAVWLTTAPASSLAAGIAAAALIAAAIVPRGGYKKSAVWFGLLWYVLYILPTLAAQKNYGVLSYSHRLYLPLAGFLIFISELDWLKAAYFRRPAAAAASAALLIFLASVSFTHSYDFSNRLSFWERAAQDSPANFTANFCLADTYAAGLGYNPAERYYRKALGIDPAAPFIHHNLGVIYYKKGEAVLAEKEFKKELDTNPAYREFTKNLKKSLGGPPAGKNGFTAPPSI